MGNELGARIRALRKERGLSQEALAQALEVSRQAVTKWEDGSSLPSTANLFALSGFFGVPLAELTGTPEGDASPSSAASISEKTRNKRAKVLCIGAWVLLAVSVVCCTPLIEKIWNVLRRSAVTRCAVILVLLVVSTAYVVGSTNSPFLYFNF